MKQFGRYARLLAALLGFFGVALGAFGAHGLKESVSPAMLAVWNTATLYLFVHVFASFIAYERSAKIAFLFSGGTMLFSGSLYLMVLTNVKMFGFITPIGGILYLVGWAWLAFGFYMEEK